MLDDKFTSEGTLTYVDGQIFEGVFEEGEFTSGKYTCILINGDKYVGNSTEVQNSGEGQLTKLNGSVFNIEFVNISRDIIIFGIYMN